MIRLYAKGFRQDEVLSLVIENTALNQILEFRTTGYDKKTFQKQDPFVVFNQVASTFSEDKNDRIWSLYHEIYNLLELDKSNARLSEAVVYCKSLLETVNYFDVRQTVIDNQLVIPSAKIFDVYTEDLGVRERTYIKSDYMDLIALSVLLKVMLPIWGQYLGEKTNKNSDAIRIAFALCESAIGQLDATIKLRQYVDSNFAANKTPLAALTFGGVSTFSLPDITFATVIVRKTATDPLLTEGNRSGTLITSAWSVISDNVKQRYGVDQYKNKKPAKATSDQDETSVLERIRPTAPQPHGVIAAMRHIYKDIPMWFAKEFPDVDNSLIWRAVENNKSSNTPWSIKPSQVLMATYLCDHFIPHAAIPHMTLDHAKAMQAASYVVMKHKGFGHLADLLAAKITKNPKNSFNIASGRPAPNEDRQNKFNDRYRVHLAPTKIDEVRHPAQAFIEQVLDDMTNNRVFEFNPITGEMGGVILPEQEVRTQLVDFIEFCLSLE